MPRLSLRRSVAAGIGPISLTAVTSRWQAGDMGGSSAAPMAEAPGPVASEGPEAARWVEVFPWIDDVCHAGGRAGQAGAAVPEEHGVTLAIIGGFGLPELLAGEKLPGAWQRSRTG
jgi:hypothetical protein